MGQRQIDCAVMFVDMRGFTRASEHPIEQKQQQEADSSRELIRTLRAELQQQQEAHQAHVQSLEERIMEFKLKFEYAQKQLKVTG